MGFRSLLYKLARVLGDVNAVHKGKLPQRIMRKTILKRTGRTINTLIK